MLWGVWVDEVRSWDSVGLVWVFLGWGDGKRFLVFAQIPATPFARILNRLAQNLELFSHQDLPTF